jgi:hypothetical protein
MHLDERNADAEQGVAQRHAGVGEGGGIDDDEGDAFRRGGVDTVDQGVFGVALEAGQLMRSQFHGQRHAAPFDIGQGRGAVDAGLAGTQQSSDSVR